MPAMPANDQDAPLRRYRQKPEDRAPARSEPQPASVWTEAKIKAVLEALNTFVYNHAKKHGVPPAEVWSLIRDEALDPERR
jgi:hypothetical protein